MTSSSQIGRIDCMLPSSTTELLDITEHAKLFGESRPLSNQRLGFAKIIIRRLLAVSVEFRCQQSDLSGTLLVVSGGRLRDSYLLF